jgi:hypothetical protein
MIKPSSHAHRHHDEPLPLSLIAQSAWIRVVGACGLLVVLWAAIGWAITKP